MQTKKGQSFTTNLFQTGAFLVGGLAAAAAGGIAYSRLVIGHHLPLPKALNTERREMELSNVGRVSTYLGEQSEGRPLVLLHSINAAASALEMKPLFDMYRSNRPVYALDLPGYGFSNRVDRKYTPEYFATFIEQFISDVVRQPADVVALSLSCEFLARAAQKTPQLFRSLTLISPSGFTDRSTGRTTEKAGKRGMGEPVYKLLTNSIWSQALYDLVTSRMSLRFYLGQSFIGEIPEELIEYGYATSHQPGAMNVPFFFLSGQLFTQDALHEIYVHLRVPTLILYDRDFYVSFDRLPELVENNDMVQAVRIEPTLGLPHWDEPGKTSAALNTFWTGITEEQ